jgi:hypothetical protein
MLTIWMIPSMLCIAFAICVCWMRLINSEGNARQERQRVVILPARRAVAQPVPKINKLCSQGRNMRVFCRSGCGNNGTGSIASSFVVCRVAFRKIGMLSFIFLISLGSCRLEQIMEMTRQKQASGDIRLTWISCFPCLTVFCFYYT